MKLKLILGMAFMAIPAIAAEPIQGTWKTIHGDIVEGTRCGKEFCLTLKTGKYAGQRIATLTGDSVHYRGTIADPVKQTSFTGTVVITTSFTGTNRLKMKGCRITLFCESEEWERITK